MDGPFLWFLNRGTGFVLLVLLTATVVLGVLAGRGRAGGLVPGFLTQTLHRDLGLLSAALLVVHSLSAVLDEYVDIRWWHALVPVGATYQPFWLGLGTVAAELVAVVMLSSVLRHRLSLRVWRTVHLSVYVAWIVSLVHGIGIGTDTGSPAADVVYLACAGAGAAVLLVRVGDTAVARLRSRAPAGSGWRR